MGLGDGPFNSSLGGFVTPIVPKHPTSTEMQAKIQHQQQLLAAAAPDHRTQYDIMRELMNVEPHLFDNGEMLNQLMAQSQASQALAQQPSTPKIPPNPPLGARAKELFLKRMGGIRAEMTLKPDDFLQMHIRDETVYMFYCFNGKDGVAKEQIDIFPSDQLIAQFRMILS
jgi:hypothetical protein